MVRPRRPSFDEIVESLARDDRGDAALLPFLALPPDVRTIDDLMVFDKAGCARHKRFVRRIHPADLPAGAPALNGTVVVTAIGFGTRSRVFYPDPEPTRPFGAS